MLVSVNMDEHMISYQVFSMNIKKIKVYVYINDNTHMSLNSINSENMYEPSSHVITGNYNIVHDWHNKSLLKTGPGYRSGQ